MKQPRTLEEAFVNVYKRLNEEEEPTNAQLDKTEAQNKLNPQMEISIDNTMDELGLGKREEVDLDPETLRDLKRIFLQSLLDSPDDANLLGKKIAITDVDDRPHFVVVKYETDSGTGEYTIYKDTDPELEAIFPTFSNFRNAR